MYINNNILIAKNDKDIYLPLKMANRHGLITGATGTGKTVTVKVLAESFSDAGVPVFLADIKGDLSGMGRPGIHSENMQGRIEKFGFFYDGQACADIQGINTCTDIQGGNTCTDIQGGNTCADIQDGSICTEIQDGNTCTAKSRAGAGAGAGSESEGGTAAASGHIFWEYKPYPVTYWDVFAKKGIPVRTTVSEMGPMLLSRLLKLNDTQEGVLNIVFRIADDRKLLLLDLKDLRAAVQFVGDNAALFKNSYGNVASSSIGAIQRGLLELESQNAEMFFAEPALDIKDWMRTDESGRGMIHILNCEELFMKPDLYAAFLLWMLSELYDTLGEAGDLDRPKMVFFFDEAHLLFNIDSKELMQKVEQVVRLIRSKGVGIYFISQSPNDVPDTVLSQLGNKIQHALRAYTPADQKAVKAAAMSFVVNPAFKTEEAITCLGTGEALVAFLNEDGVPQMVERAFILPPQSLMGPAGAEFVAQSISGSGMNAKYGTSFDRESAYEQLVGKVDNAQGNISGQKADTLLSSAQDNVRENVPGRISDPDNINGQDEKDRADDEISGSKAEGSKTVNLTQQFIEKKKREKQALASGNGTDADDSGDAQSRKNKDEDASSKKNKNTSDSKTGTKSSSSSRKSSSSKRSSSTERELGKAAISVGKTAANTLVRGILKNLVK